MKALYRTLALAAFVAGGLTGCFNEEPDLATTRFYCKGDVDCLAGYTCVEDPDGDYCAPVTEKRDVVYEKPGGDTSGGDDTPE